MADEKKRSSWRVSLKLPSLKEIAKRLSGSRTDNLSNEVVRYRGVSVRALKDIRDRLLRGTAAKGVELLVAEDELANGINPGHTLLRTGKNKGVAAYRTGTIKFKPNQVRAKPREDWTVEDVCAHFVLPLTLPKRCFFLDLLEPEDVGKPFEGAFVSQCRQYKFTDLVSTLLESGVEFVWFDVFCANQPLLTDKQASMEVRTQHWDVLNKGFHSAIARFDSVLLVFDSWQNPTPLQRAWCVWEMYGAALSGNNLRIVFAGSEATSVEQWLRGYSEETEFLRVLADMDPRKMQCHDAKDLDMITTAIEAMDGGFSRLKQLVTERLTRWLLVAVEACVKGAEEGKHDSGYAELLHAAAMVLDDVCQFDAALSFYLKALSIRKGELGERDPSVAATLGNIAIIYETQGKLDRALDMCKEALAIFQEAHGAQHPSVSNMLNNIARVYLKQGRLGLALDVSNEALAITRETLGARSASEAETLGNMCGVYVKQGKLDLALETSKDALSIAKEALGDRHSSVADALVVLASVHTAQASLDPAIETYGEALNIYREVLGQHHLSVADTLYNMALLFELKASIGDALRCAEEAHDVYAQVYGSSSGSEIALVANAQLLKRLRKASE